MKFAKKSLGQNFLIDKNIIKKIINLADIKNRNIIEIGPGKGALTEEILKKNPKSLILIEKDLELAQRLKKKYSSFKHITIHNKDILSFNIENICLPKTAILGNLPYNISSQILVKLIKFKKWSPQFKDIIFMFQKELGEKILAKFPSQKYGRLSILTSYRLNILNRFYVSPNCFFPKPKITSVVIHFQPKKKVLHNIKKIDSLEKVTNIFFSNKRKMINKNIRKIFNEFDLKIIKELDLNIRPSEVSPDIYYRITELFEKK